MTYLFTAIG